MQYDFDTPIDRTHTWSIKHDFKKENGKADDILPLWVADMDFRSPDSVVEALKKAVDHGIFGYSRADESYFDAVAAWYQKRHHLTLQPEWMTCTPGIVFALSIAVRAFTQEGDAVLIQPPVYHPFSRAILRNKRTLVENPLVLKDGHYEMDLEELEQKVLDEHVKLMILCNPHNPVGRVWTREELTALADICLRHHVYVISDEIHGDFVWQGHEQTPYASISEEACLHSMMCTAPSKTFNLAGMATSNLFIPDPEMRRKFRSELLDVGQENMNRLGLFACRAAYEGGGEWLDQLIGYLAGNLALVRDFCKNRVPQIQLVEPEGTYLAWLDCRELGMTDDELMAFFSNEAKVWLDPGTHSGEQGSGFMRFNLGSSRSVIAQALDQIEAAWKKRNA
ncbi:MULTISPECIES: MalY/PatB family protein [Clostridium]|jgi:cystathionine beta-lyase|uniref:MalY/PatB family protein n=1 Tax=Clostridium TaxID=1485 RepID=UPI000E542800|nr:MULTISPECIES: MalY/PatB family protein [Clostridium]RHQ20648.1 pyridoxal phosphate-dependent aminotransferase [Clostridium sp. AM48-13]MBD9273840.1 pyridoxal phosphate-dependent aminotransferase [Clostridium sp.]MCC2170165.1 pyridoxal phosphate-dependent aminotransferase [Clostridium fessum]RGH16725.1 pyridoxal phosphate-dependent aminotransferase [Clostridium sp. AF12-41]RHO09889.1 pyridoxal phosphate-dependent aminotransferase [Clostridium sp. AM18-55]